MAFRRQQASAAALGYDPDGPPALKGSPLLSGSDDNAGARSGSRSDDEPGASRQRHRSAGDLGAALEGASPGPAAAQHTPPQGE